MKSSNPEHKIRAEKFSESRKSIFRILLLPLALMAAESGCAPSLSLQDILHKQKKLAMQMGAKDTGVDPENKSVITCNVVEFPDGSDYMKKSKNMVEAAKLLDEINRILLPDSSSDSEGQISIEELDSKRTLLCLKNVKIQPAETPSAKPPDEKAISAERQITPVSPDEISQPLTASDITAPPALSKVKTGNDFGVIADNISGESRALKEVENQINGSKRDKEKLNLPSDAKEVLVLQRINMGFFKTCHAKYRWSDSGRLEAVITITSEGKVRKVEFDHSSTLKNEDVRQCVIGNVKGWNFSKRTEENEREQRFTLIFH